MSGDFKYWVLGSIMILSLFILVFLVSANDNKDRTQIIKLKLEIKCMEAGLKDCKTFLKEEESK